MEEVMIDIETFSLKPDAIIRSIGAVRFDLKSGVVNKAWPNAPCSAPN